VSARDVERVLRVGGQVAFGVTNLATAWPHGGTGLGVVTYAVVMPNRKTFAVRGADDKYAGQITDVYNAGENWTLGLSLRQWEDDILTAIFRNYTTAVSGNKVLVDAIQMGSSGLAPGASVPSLGNLLFTPNNPEHPAVLFYDVRPIIEETNELLLTAINELQVDLVFQALHTGSRLYQMGLLTDLSLS